MARIRLALSGSEILYSAMCLTTVQPMPRPAIPPIMPAVELIMPYSPNPDWPSNRAKKKETTMDIPRDTAKATPPQRAPRAKRCRVPVPQNSTRRVRSMDHRRTEWKGSGICTGTMPIPPEKSSVRPASSLRQIAG